MFRIFSFLILFATILHGQNFIAAGEIGKLKNASAFNINPTSDIFVVCENEIIKIDTLGKELKKTGGYGWTSATFDEIPDIFVNALQVIAADKNNDRIQFFDRNLNFLSEFKTHNYENEDNIFRYPSAVGVSGIGDLYILDSENSRIMKYNLSGDYLLNIGGYEAGDYQLTNPLDFVTDARGNIYVLENGLVMVFDQYGAGLRKIKLDKNYNKLRGYASGLIAINSDEILLLNLKENKQSIHNFEVVDIIDARFHQGKLFILSPEKIHIFNVIK